MTEITRNSKKGIAGFNRSNYPQQSKLKPVGHESNSTEDNMRSFTAPRGHFLCIAAALVCLVPGIAWADGESTGGGESTPLTLPDLGTGIFSRLPLHVSASVRGGYDDNVNTTQFGKQDSWFTNASAILSYTLGTPRTNLTLSTTTGITYYFANVSNQYEPDLNLSLVLTHKASPRLSFTVNAFASYQTEPDFQYGLGTNRRNGNYFSTQDKFGVTYLWTPRFSTATSYTFGAVRYDDIATGLFEDRVENTIGNEFRFLLWPTTSLVGEYRFQVVSYAHEGGVIVPAMPAVFDINGVLVTPARPAVQLQRDSTTHFLLAGLDHAFSSRITISLRGGMEIRDYYDDPATGETTSPYFEGTVNYALGKDTTVAWTNRYGIEEGDVAFNPTRTTFRTGLQGTHRLASRISGTVSAYFTHDNYDSFTSGTTVNPSFTEDTVDISVSLRYAVTRYLGAEAGYNHGEVSSGSSLRDYSRNRIWGGLNFAF
ncbi:MAG: hypothetical protein QOG67_1271 [Verrucomicrobiota bacterium]|jgi:hypothetical protein